MLVHIKESLIDNSGKTDREPCNEMAEFWLTDNITATSVPQT